MALNFPTPPSPGDIYTADNGIVYTYDGVKWVGSVPTANPFDQSLNTTDNVTFANVVPNADNTYDLGSPTRQWRHIYASTGSIYLGNVKLSTDQGKLDVTNVTYDIDNDGNIINEQIINNYALTSIDRLVSSSTEYSIVLGNDGNLTIPGGITKDDQTLTFTTIDPLSGFTGLQVGISEPSTNTVIFGNNEKGLMVQGTGAVVVQSGLNTEAPLILAGAWGNAPETDGGDVMIYGGYSYDGTEGRVFVEGSEVIVGAFNSINLWAGESAEWNFYGDDSSMQFPDGTLQYTAWQGATIVSDSAPTDDLGRLWFNSTDGRLYVKYNDLWVDANPTVVPSPETYLDDLSIDGTTIRSTDNTVVVDGDLNFTGNLYQDGVLFQATNYSLINGDYTLSLNTDGTVTVPGLIHLNYNDSEVGFIDTTSNGVLYGAAVGKSIAIQTDDHPGNDRGQHTWLFTANGDLMLAGSTVASSGRYYQDCSDGWTSMRWVNANDNGEPIEIVRVYSDGGVPYENIEDENNERVQLGYREIEPSISSFYVIATQNEDGIGDDSLDQRWEFQGTGNLVLPQTSFDASPAPTSWPGITFSDGTFQNTAYSGDVGITIADTAPEGSSGKLWFNSSDGRTYIKYNDQWVDTSPLIVPALETYLEGLVVEGTSITTVERNTAVNIDADLTVTGSIAVAGNAVPDLDHQRSLGTATRRWAELHVDIIDGGAAATWLEPV